VMSTGMGGPSMAIAVEELQKIGVEAAVRIGSCGALQPEVRVGDLVMVEAAVRDEGTSLGYAPLSYPAVADHRLLTACEESAKEAGCRFHTGIARSHDCLYRDDNPVIYEEWAKKGVLASDMETAALFVVGRIRGMRTASILNVVAACKGNVAENIGRYVDGETLTAQGEEYEILTAFAALTRQ
ncbi:MAG: nucleoside phosphorylase, partial [Clostridium sp.]